MLPYFYVMSFTEKGVGGGNALTLAMVASVVANVSGLMTGGLYLFLKSNTLSVISPRDKAGEYQSRKLKYKIRRTEDDDFDGHMLDHVRGQGGLRRMNSDASLISNEKEQELWDERRRPTSSIYDDQVPNPLRSHSVYPMSGMPRAPEPAKFSVMSSALGHMRKRSYSLFPGSLRTKSYAPSTKSYAPSTKSSVTLLPSTTYSPNSNDSAMATLRPPPSMRALTGGRHRRDSSLVSTATVQIGLRFSNMEDMPPVVNNNNSTDTKVYHLDCPKLRDKDKDSPLSGRPAALDSPIKSPSKEDDDAVEDGSPKRNPWMKTLPAVPATDVAPIYIRDEDDSDGDDDGDDDDYEKNQDEITLRPKVYSPQGPTKTKVASPRGVGFTMLTSSATSKPSSGSTSPPPKPAGAATKSDWI